MLYITSRNNYDTYTSNRALCNDVAPDGGRFAPFKIPQFTSAEILELRDKSFGQIIAEILNIFFSANLTAFDVACCIGQNVFKAVQMNHRICVGEMWHNMGGDYALAVNSLYKKVSNNNHEPSAWFCTVVRVATIFALYGQMLRQEIITDGQSFDISTNAGDLSEPVSIIYARQMGLPIGTVICTCIEDNFIWDLVHHGYISSVTDKNMMLGIEQLIHMTLGQHVVSEFGSAMNAKSIYTISEALLPLLNEGLFCSVAGSGRSDATINSVYRTCGYIMDPDTALCYSGLQDYRAKTGSTSVTLLLSKKNPLHSADTICKATGLQETALFEIFR